MVSSFPGTAHCQVTVKISGFWYALAGLRIDRYELYNFSRDEFHTILANMVTLLKYEIREPSDRKCCHVMTR